MYMCKKSSHFLRNSYRVPKISDFGERKNDDNLNEHSELVRLNKICFHSYITINPLLFTGS